MVLEDLRRKYHELLKDESVLSNRLLEIRSQKALTACRMVKALFGKPDDITDTDLEKWCRRRVQAESAARTSG